MECTLIVNQNASTAKLSFKLLSSCVDHTQLSSNTNTCKKHVRVQWNTYHSWKQLPGRTLLAVSAWASVSLEQLNTRTGRSPDPEILVYKAFILTWQCAYISSPRVVSPDVTSHVHLLHWPSQTQLLPLQWVMEGSDINVRINFSISCMHF